MRNVTIVYRGDAFTKAEYINLKRMEATPNIDAKFKTNIVEILGDKTVNKVKFDTGEEMETQGVFIEIGASTHHYGDELGETPKAKSLLIT
jgi:thioredoxin reductase